MAEEPRCLDADATARYLSVCVDALPRLVRLKRIPKPNYALGPRSPQWDREARSMLRSMVAHHQQTRVLPPRQLSARS
jgi:hypothetical protein